MTDRPFGMADAELDSLLAACPTTREPEPPPEQTVQAMAALSAERLMRRYRFEALELASARRQYEAEQMRLKLWWETQEARRGRTLDWLALALGILARDHADATGGRDKTLRTPWGNVSVRRTPDRLDVVDAEAAADWLEAQVEGGQYVRVKRDVAKDEVARALKTGLFQEVPGIVTVPGADVVRVKPDLTEGANPDDE